MQGTVKGKEGKEDEKRWKENLKEWTEMDFASTTSEVVDRAR